MMNDMFSIDSVVATRRGSFCLAFRGLKPTAKVIGPLRGQDIADLTAAADAFESSFSNTAAATAEHVAATADTSAKIREGMVAVCNSPPARGGVAAFRGRGGGSDGVAQNKYNNDPGKLAAWLSASHVEKAPKIQNPTP